MHHRIYSAFIICSLWFSFCLSCVTPPLDCPNENITFWLFTKANPEDPHEVKVMDVDSIKTAPWVPDAPIKLLIHGYAGHKHYSPNTEIRPAYLECCDYNVMSVDYSPISKEPCYLESARNTEVVGKCTAQMIDELVLKHKFDLKKFHVIGFSLGAQIAGYIANHLTSGRLGRISGLDPAMPLFVTSDTSKKLDITDADYVDILHTNALEKGKLEASGHSDFFANGGMKQPGCTASADFSRSGCDHARATNYFGESILTKVGFYATKCASWITYMIGWCEMDSDDGVMFGEYVPQTAVGMYFFLTNSEAPFARGHEKRPPREAEYELENYTNKSTDYI